MNLTAELRTIGDLGTATAGASIVVCTLSIISLVLLKLYTKPSYRLALYQVSSSLLFGVAGLGAFYTSPTHNPDFDLALCKAFAFLTQYTIWMILMLTACLTLHLFCLSVLYNNLGRLEAVYVLCSLLVPLAIAVIPFSTHTYGLSDAWCWIQNWDGLEKIVPGEAEQYALFYGPAFVILLVCIAALVVMCGILSCRAYRKGKGWQEIGGEQHQLLLKQLLPLIIYPIILFLFFIPPFANRLYTIWDLHPPIPLLYATVLFITLWSMAPGLALLIHMIMVCYIIKRRHAVRGRGRGLSQSGKRNYGPIEKEGTATARLSKAAESLNSETYYNIPSEH